MFGVADESRCWLIISVLMSVLTAFLMTHLLIDGKIKVWQQVCSSIRSINANWLTTSQLKRSGGSLMRYKAGFLPEFGFSLTVTDRNVHQNADGFNN